MRTPKVPVCRKADYFWIHKPNHTPVRWSLGTGRTVSGVLIVGETGLLLHVPKPFGSASFLGRWHPPAGFWDRLLVRTAGSTNVVTISTIPEARLVCGRLVHENVGGRRFGRRRFRS